MMRAITMTVLSAALGAGAVGAAVTLKPAAASSESIDRERHPGPDSGRVAILLDALGKTDPVVCELIGDQIGNFWNSGERGGVGRLAATPTSLQAAKDSIGGHITDPRAINRLVSELSAPNPCVRRVASKMLGNSAIAAGRLRTLLGDASPTIREAAAHAAGVGEVRDVLAALENSLGDRDASVAAMAAWAIGEIEDRSSIPALVKAMKGEPRVRLAAIWAIGQIDDKNAAPEVIPALRDADAVTRALAADVLGELESPASIAPLERALGDDSDARVREAAARALGELSAASSATVLGHALSDADIAVRRAAAAALGELDDLHTAPPGLVAALQSTDAELRENAASALAEIADPTTASALVGLLSDKNRDIRKHAVEALGEIGTPVAVAGLTRALEDRDAEVRRAAVEALGESKERN
jgi:HEAT repeat protein